MSAGTSTSAVVAQNAAATTLANAPKSRALTTKVQLHMSVVLSILDHHMRRNASSTTRSDRVIGTLLGVQLGGGLIEITGSYPVPHVEKDKEVAVGKDFNRQMKALHARSSPGEQIVGWYATSTSPEASIDAKSCLVHDFYSSSECVNPVHLVVDVSLAAPLSVRAFHSVALASSAVSRALAAEFRPLPLEMHASEPERIAIAALAAKRDPAQGTSQSLEQSVERLLSLLDAVCAYVDDVVDGRIPPDAEMGKKIADLVSAVPHIAPEAFSSSFSRSVQDLLMIVMLSNLTRAQLCIAEKLGSVM
jgi:translation initiation factor 3 subunit F